MKAFLQELFRTRLYKRTQGRKARQVTFFAVLVTLAGALWRLHQQLEGAGPAWQFSLPLVLLLAGGWAAFRLVNVPVFADFLIAVEAEMNKVSWPTRTELYRSSIVVLVVIFVLGAILFGFDFYWNTAFKIIGVLPDPPADPENPAAGHLVRGIEMGLATLAVAALALWAVASKSKQ